MLYPITFTALSLQAMMHTVAGFSVKSPNVGFSMLYGRTLHPAPVPTSPFNFCIGE